MRYFLENFKGVYNKDWPFGQFPAWQYYPSTGTHIGTDFKVAIGTPILAPLTGEMFKTEWNQYKGNVGIFVFTHGGVEWGLELCHLRELPQKGTYSAGQVIAHSGNTGGTTTGAHLHAVLHRDATVTKHYQELRSREDFLRLEQNGDIVDCYQWFTIEVPKATTPTTTSAVVIENETTTSDSNKSVVKDMPLPKKNKKKPTSFFDKLAAFFRALFP